MLNKQNEKKKKYQTIKVKPNKRQRKKLVYVSHITCYKSRLIVD